MEKVLFVANADNNSVAVIDVRKPGRSEVLGFVPSGWYPSALAIGGKPRALYVGNSKGLASYSNIRGPHSPLPPGEEGKGSVKELMKGSVNILEIAEIKKNLKRWTKQVFDNCPYNDELLSRARPPKAPSVVLCRWEPGPPSTLIPSSGDRTYDRFSATCRRVMASAPPSGRRS
jgi:hypothetical protein